MPLFPQALDRAGTVAVTDVAVYQSAQLVVCMNDLFGIDRHQNARPALDVIDQLLLGGKREHSHSAKIRSFHDMLFVYTVILFI